MTIGVRVPPSQPGSAVLFVHDADLRAADVDASQSFPASNEEKHVAYSNRAPLDIFAVPSVPGRRRKRGVAIVFRRRSDRPLASSLLRAHAFPLGAGGRLPPGVHIGA